MVFDFEVLISSEKRVYSAIVMTVECGPSTGPHSSRTSTLIVLRCGDCRPTPSIYEFVADFVESSCTILLELVVLIKLAELLQSLVVSRLWLSYVFMSLTVTLSWTLWVLWSFLFSFFRSIRLEKSLSTAMEVYRISDHAYYNAFVVSGFWAHAYSSSFL